jgi:hypothetical protein
MIGYMGSGLQLRNSLKKHGKENHKVEILEHCFSVEFLRSREKEIVNEELLKDSLCMNLTIGGEGGAHFLGKKHSEKTLKKLSDISKNYILTDEQKENQRLWAKSQIGKKHSEESKKKMSEHARNRINAKPHSEETKKKISDSLKGKKHTEEAKIKMRGKTKIYTCPHCSKVGKTNAMFNWHFDNCKVLKNNSGLEK